MKYLRRSNYNKVLGGVCGGLGQHFGIDPVLVRIAFVALFFVFGIGLIPYIILWILMPSQ